MMNFRLAASLIAVLFVCVLPCEALLYQNIDDLSIHQVGDLVGPNCSCWLSENGVICFQTEGLYESFVLQQNKEWIKQIKDWLPSEMRDYRMRLCYRGSIIGWASSTFHRKCHHKGPTIVLVKSGPYVFGGYTDAWWDMGSTHYERADSSFIFSLKNKDNLAPFKSPVYRNHANAIYTNDNYGATFGGGFDLYIANNAGANKNSYTKLGYTYQPPSGYTYKSTSIRNLLAGHYHFTPDEVEVYYFLIA